MNIAIVYLSRRGTTEEVAHLLTQCLTDHKVTLFNLDENLNPDLSDYPGVIIGGPIYIGELPEKLRNYMMEHIEVLGAKRLGLFICGMIPDKQKQQEEIARAFPTVLQRKAKAMAFMGGAFVQDRLNLLEKIIVLFIAKTRKNVQKIDHQAIENFCVSFLAP